MYRKNIVYSMIASVIIIHLLLTRQVFGLYESIWNAYFEQPCCEKDFMKHHRGKRKITITNECAIEKSERLLISLYLFYDNYYPQLLSLTHSCCCPSSS